MFDLYPLLRTILFRFPPEKSHSFSLKALDWAHKFGLLKILFPAVQVEPKNLLGLSFPNPVGLAAGLDKDAEHILSLAALGFGFIEVGTVTPYPQPGNPLPRLFRLTDQRAIINRMGFNNKGLEYVLDNIKTAHFKGVLGVNIGKNYATLVDRAIDDYLFCLKRVYAFADYIVINISSPNTPGLRALQLSDQLPNLLRALKEEQASLKLLHGKVTPLLIKVSPDMAKDELAVFAQQVTYFGIEGVIATNTTLSRKGVERSLMAGEVGGLSGEPLFHSATEAQAFLRGKLGENVAMIGVGGIHSASQAMEKFKQGADLVQLYSGFIYEGPHLIRRILKAYKNR